MSQNRVPDTQTLLAIQNATAAGGILEKVTAHLFVNDIQPSENSVLGDFTEASFPGYSGSASITWGLAYVPSRGTSQVTGDRKEFQASDGTTPQTAYGWYGVGVGADSVNLKMAERFDTPIGVAGPLNIVIVMPQVSLTLSGASVVEGP